MAEPTTISCPKNTWTKIAEGVSNIDILRSKAISTYLMIYLPWRSAAPTTLDNAGIIFYSSDKHNINSDRGVDVYIYAMRFNGSVIVYDNSGINQIRNIFQRPMSTNGRPTGTYQLNVDGSTTPVEFYLEAIGSERLLVSRFIISIRSASNIGINQYGDLSALTNGIQVYYSPSTGPLAGQKINLIYPLTIQRNEDWGRWCYDSTPVPIGPTQNTQTWQGRWTLTKYGNPYGIIVEPGDKFGVIVNDNLSGLSDHTIMAEGTHLGPESTDWLNIIP